MRRAQWKYCLKVELTEAQPKVARETGCFHIVHDIPLIFFSSEPCRLNVSQSSLSQVHNRAFLSRVSLMLIISQRLRNTSYMHNPPTCVHNVYLLFRVLLFFLTLYSITYCQVT